MGVVKGVEPALAHDEYPEQGSDVRIDCEGASPKVQALFKEMHSRWRRGDFNQPAARPKAAKPHGLAKAAAAAIWEDLNRKR